MDLKFSFKTVLLVIDLFVQLHAGRYRKKCMYVIHKHMKCWHRVKEHFLVVISRYITLCLLDF